MILRYGECSLDNMLVHHRVSPSNIVHLDGEVKKKCVRFFKT